MWLVDSTVWIDYFNGVPTPQTTRLDVSLGQIEICVGDIILCEVLQGFREQREFESARAALMKFPIYNIGGTTLALKSAENYRALRRMGITVRNTVDCLIATFAIERNFDLLHGDRDFGAFENYLGLSIVRVET